MKSHLLLLAFLAFSFRLSATNITIIESSQSSSWSVQDTVWKFIAGSMGYNATIVPQNTLASIDNLSGTDVLIVSSATKAFSSTDYLQTIQQFILSGRPAYIQSEWVVTAQGNVAFESLMQLVGADFHWVESTSGQLTPMTVTGSMASTPDNVNALTYFNAGYTGTGTGVEKFLEFNSNFYGFCYTDPTGNKGSVMTTSDQDWIWHNESPALIKNMLFRLVSSITTEAPTPQNTNSSFTIYPNPARETLTIRSFSRPTGPVSLFTIGGQLLSQKPTATKTTQTLDVRNLSPGLYFLKVNGNSYRFSKQ